MSDLGKVSIGIKAFLRDKMLFETVDAILVTIPEAQIIIADDGEEYVMKKILYDSLQSRGHVAIQCDFDSGFGYKSNQIAEAFLLSGREYLLIASDDFNFRPPEVREGIEDLVRFLHFHPEVDIASGRVNNRSYEFDLIDEGTKITEIPKTEPVFSYNFMGWYISCDLTVNYSLVRRAVFEKVRWDDDVKIGGGEHGSWFLDCKRAGFKTVWVPGVNIDEQPRVWGANIDSRYVIYRARAKSPARPCFDKRGIREYVLGCGHVDYTAPGFKCRICGKLADLVMIDKGRTAEIKNFKPGQIIECDDPTSLRLYCKECLPCAS